MKINKVLLYVTPSTSAADDVAVNNTWGCDVRQWKAAEFQCHLSTLHSQHSRCLNWWTDEQVKERVMFTNDDYLRRNMCFKFFSCTVIDERQIFNGTKQTTSRGDKAKSELWWRLTPTNAQKGWSAKHLFALETSKREEVRSDCLTMSHASSVTF